MKWAYEIPGTEDNGGFLRCLVIDLPGRKSVNRQKQYEGIIFWVENLIMANKRVKSDYGYKMFEIEKGVKSSLRMHKITEAYE